MDERDLADRDGPPGCSLDHAVVHPTDTHAVYEGFVTFENGLSVNGPREKATVCVDNTTNTITVTMKNPASVFVAPGYPIVIEGPLPHKEETENRPSCHEESKPNKGKKTKDIRF